MTCWLIKRRLKFYNCSHIDSPPLSVWPLRPTLCPHAINHSSHVAWMKRGYILVSTMCWVSLLYCINDKHLPIKIRKIPYGTHVYTHKYTIHCKSNKMHYVGGRVDCHPRWCAHQYIRLCAIKTKSTQLEATKWSFLFRHHR